MRTAALAGLIVSLAYLILHLPRLLSNADFIYMCTGAAMLADGSLPASPYFPPGYPALIWLLMKVGLSALTAGAAWSAVGSGLLAGSVAYVARLWQTPAAPAALLGLLAASLPSVFIVSLNPHLDALYAGLGAVLLACALRTLQSPPGGWVYSAALLSGVVLISLRYHAALLVMPIALVLAFSRARGARALGLTVLVVGACAIAATLYALQLTTGSLRTAGLEQVRTGASARELGSEEETGRVVFDNYAQWLETYPPADAAMVLEGIAANWPLYLTRKAVLGGALLWLVAVLIRRREPPGAVWLLLFILGYTLAISPAYFIARASPLPEAAGMMLASAGLSALFFNQPPRQQGRHRKPRFAIDPAIAGAVVFMLALGGVGYNAWRLRPILPEQLQRARQLRAVNAQALEVVGGNRRQLFGSMHSTGIYGTNRFNLPAPTWSRLWMDDPAVAGLVDPYLPRLDPTDVWEGRSGVTAILLWNADGSDAGGAIRAALDDSAGSGIWERVRLQGEGDQYAQLWRRRMSEVKTGGGTK